MELELSIVQLLNYLFNDLIRLPKSCLKDDHKSRRSFCCALRRLENNKLIVSSLTGLPRFLPIEADRLTEE